MSAPLPQPPLSSEPFEPSLSRTPPPMRVYVALLAHTLISGCSYLAAKQALVELSPGTVMVFRLLLSAPIFLVIMAFLPGPKLPPREAWKPMILLGLLGGPFNQGLYLLGLSRSNPAHASLLYALTPIGVYLFSLAVGRERVRPARIIGIVVAFGGVAVLLLGRGLAQAVGPMLGDLMILCAVAAWVLYTTEGKRYSRRFGPVRTTAWTQIAAAGWTVFAAPFYLSTDSIGRLSLLGWLCIAFLVVFVSVGSYLLWYYALSRAEASRVTVFSNFQPVATALAARVAFGDSLVWEIYVGGMLVLLGVRLTQRAPTPAGRGPG